MKHTLKQIVLFLALTGMIIMPLSAMNFIDYTTMLGCFALIISIGVAATGLVFYQQYSAFQKQLQDDFCHLEQK